MEPLEYYVLFMLIVAAAVELLASGIMVEVARLRYKEGKKAVAIGYGLIIAACIVYVFVILTEITLPFQSELQNYAKIFLYGISVNCYILFHLLATRGQKTRRWSILRTAAKVSLATVIVEPFIPLVPQLFWVFTVLEGIKSMGVTAMFLIMYQKTKLFGPMGFATAIGSLMLTEFLGLIKILDPVIMAVLTLVAVSFTTAALLRMSTRFLLEGIMYFTLIFFTVILTAQISTLLYLPETMVPDRTLHILRILASLSALAGITAVESRLYIKYMRDREIYTLVLTVGFEFMKIATFLTRLVSIGIFLNFATNEVEIIGIAEYIMITVGVTLVSVGSLHFIGKDRFAGIFEFMGAFLVADIYLRGVHVSIEDKLATPIDFVAYTSIMGILSFVPLVVFLYRGAVMLKAHNPHSWKVFSIGLYLLLAMMASILIKFSILIYLALHTTGGFILIFGSVGVLDALSQMIWNREI